MTSLTIADQLFERQGRKLVLTPNGVENIPPGRVPGPDQEILAREGEPAFSVRLEQAVDSDADVPDAVGLALRTVAERMYRVMDDGRETGDGDGPVEWVLGPAVYDGGIVLWLDTDGFGIRRKMIDTMTAIFVEELGHLEIAAVLSVGPDVPDAIQPAWRSSTERSSG